MSGGVQLPECLRIVAHLRRIGVFSESEMRLQVRRLHLCILFVFFFLYISVDYLLQISRHVGICWNELEPKSLMATLTSVFYFRLTNLSYHNFGCLFHVELIIKGQIFCYYRMDLETSNIFFTIGMHIPGYFCFLAKWCMTWQLYTFLDHNVSIMYLNLRSWFWNVDLCQYVSLTYFKFQAYLTIPRYTEQYCCY